MSQAKLAEMGERLEIAGAMAEGSDAMEMAEAAKKLEVAKAAESKEVAGDKTEEKEAETGLHLLDEFNYFKDDLILSLKGTQPAWPAAGNSH